MTEVLLFFQRVHFFHVAQPDIQRVLVDDVFLTETRRPALIRPHVVEQGPSDFAGNNLLWCELAKVVSGRVVGGGYRYNLVAAGSAVILPSPPAAAFLFLGFAGAVWAATAALAGATATAVPGLLFLFALVARGTVSGAARLVRVLRPWPGTAAKKIEFSKRLC